VRASWRQATVHKVVAAWPLVHAGDGSGRALAYRVRKADGSVIELGADVVCERLSNEHRERIWVTVDRAAHVIGRHMRGDLAGVFAQGITLTRLLALFCRHHRERLGYGEGSRQIKVVCDREIGTGGVVSAARLAQRGVLNDGDLDRLAALKEEVFAANVYGSAEQRSALVARANAQWRERNVRLAQRNGVVLPAFIAAPEPTRSFVVVLDAPRGIGTAADDHKRVRTIYPGELLCDSPAHDRYKPLLSVSELPPGATIGLLQRKHDNGHTLTEREEQALRGYRRAFDVWYQHGILVPAPPGRRAEREGSPDERPAPRTVEERRQAGAGT
jgi:hypothetical protein